MHSSAYLKIVSFIVLLAFSRCAQVVPLSGGKKDTTPPVLQKAVPASGSVLFSARLVIFEFDEFVQVRDLNNELLISPRLKTAPDVKAVGRNILVDLSGCTLEPNTTYRFSFGKSIADMNESNSVPNLEYVFSTGSFLDTLSLSGTVTMASDNTPAANMMAGLYHVDKKVDSLPYIYEPDYIVKSNAAGQFRFTNLPASDFYIYIIGDKNKNQLYDGEAEQIAFSPNTVRPGKDTLRDLKMFREQSSRLFLKKTMSAVNGAGQLIYTMPVTPSISPIRKQDIAKVWIDPKKEDTIKVFYHGISDTLALLDRSTEKTDTLYLPVPVSRNKNASLPFKLQSPQGIPGKNDQLLLTFPVWMDTQSVRKTGIHLLTGKDSVIVLGPSAFRWKNIHQLEINCQLSEAKEYRLKMDSAAVRSMSKLPADTSAISFRTKSRTDFGKLSLKLKLIRKEPYIIRLVTEDFKVVAQQTVSVPMSSSNAVTLDFPELPQGTYRVVFIWDDNANGEWDTGNVIRKLQPEKLSIHSKQIKIPADWEVEEEISEK